jgi:glycosyltransferase involved in cell wall biosynthesis
MTKHILIYTYSFFPKIDGVTMRYKNIIKEFIKLNFKITLILTRKCENVPDDFIEYLNKCTIIYYRPYCIPSYEECTIVHPKDYIKSFIELYKYCVNNKVNIIHQTAPDIFNIILIILGKILKIKNYCFYHTYLVGSVKNNKYFKNYTNILHTLEKFYLSFCDGIIYPTNEIKEIMNINMHNYFIFPLSLDTNIFKSVKYNIDEFYKKNHKKLLYIGRIAGDKNIYFLIKIIKCIKNTSLVIIGNGPDKENVIKLINKYNLNDRIRILNAMEQKELVKFYSNCDIYISPSIYETMGFSTMEALACGTPVIGMNAIGTRAIIKHGYNGFLIRNIKDVKIYMDKLNDIIFFNIIKKNCLESVKEMSFEYAVKQLINYYSL